MFNSEAWSVTAEAHILFSSLLCSVFYGISNQDQIEASSNFFLHFFENLETFSDKISKQKYWFMEERKKSQKITRYSLNCLNFFWDIKPLNPSWIFHLFGPFFFTLDFSEMIKFLPFTILEKWEEEEVVVVLAVGAQCTAVTKKWKNNSISNC